MKWTQAKFPKKLTGGDLNYSQPPTNKICICLYICCMYTRLLLEKCIYLLYVSNKCNICVWRFYIISKYMFKCSAKCLNFMLNVKRFVSRPEEGLLRDQIKVGTKCGEP